MRRNRRPAKPCEKCGTNRFRTVMKNAIYQCRFCGQMRNQGDN